MRTATKFIEGKDTAEFVSVVKNYFPGGKIAVIAQDREEGDSLARLLGREYTVETFSPKEEIVSGARFFIGVGGSGVVPAVKRAALSAKYAFIPAVFDYRFFYSADEIRTLPEFVFLSEDVRSAEKDYCLRLYVTVFQLYAESVFGAFYASAYPFRDKQGEAFIKSAENFLRGEEDSETFYSTALRLIAGYLNTAYAKGKKRIVTEKAAQKYGVTSGERFTVTYFLLLMLKNFTKHPFRAILLPSGKTTRNGKAVNGNVFDADLLPSEETLRTVKRKVKFLTETPKPEIGDFLNVVRECADEPIFAILQEEGITDALQHERSKGHNGLLV